MATRRSLGELQHAILAVLWGRGEATVSDVHQALLPGRPLAPTTVATMLRKMEARGLVVHRTEGRQFVYRAAREKTEVDREMVSDVLQRAFAGDASALVSHLLQEGDFDPADLSALSAMIAARVQQLEGEDDA